MAIKATFTPGAGLLSVTGDNAKNKITVSRDAAGNLLVDGGAVPIVGGQATVAQIGEVGGYLSMVGLLGWAFGGFIFGIVADYIGRVRALDQARGPFPLVPTKPLVAGFAADPILPAQRRHRILARQNPGNKLRPFVHLTGLSPRHRQVPPADSSDLSPIHPVNSVTNLSGSYTPA